MIGTFDAVEFEANLANKSLLLVLVFDDAEVVEVVLVAEELMDDCLAPVEPIWRLSAKCELRTMCVDSSLSVANDSSHTLQVNT